jgi:hypothetical protein
MQGQREEQRLCSCQREEQRLCSCQREEQRLCSVKGKNRDYAVSKGGTEVMQCQREEQRLCSVKGRNRNYAVVAPVSRPVREPTLDRTSDFCALPPLARSHLVLIKCICNHKNTCKHVWLS